MTVRGDFCRRSFAGCSRRRIRANRGLAQKVNRRFCHHDFHDGFAVAGAGDASGFGIGVTATTDQRRITDAPGKFAARAAGRSSGKQVSVLIKGHGPHGALLMATVMRRGVLVFPAFEPGCALGLADQPFRIAQRDSVLYCETFRTFTDQHHVRAILEDGSRNADGVLHALQRGHCTGTERSAVHDDGIALHAAVEVQVRAVAGVKNRIVFQHDDGSFDGVEGLPAL